MGREATGHGDSRTGPDFGEPRPFHSPTPPVEAPIGTRRRRLLAGKFSIAISEITTRRHPSPEPDGAVSLRDANPPPLAVR